MDRQDATRDGGPAPPPAPDLQRRRSRRGPRVVLAVVLVLVGVGALVSLVVGEATGERTDEVVGVVTVDVDLDNAGIEVVAGEGDAVVLDREVTTGWLGGEETVQQVGDVLEVRLDCPAFGVGLFGLGCHGSYRVTVPPGTTVVGATGNGDLRLDGLDGDVDLATSNGSVSLAGTSGTLAVRTSNGTISGTAIASPVVDLASSNGRVELAFATAPRSVVVRTSNGDVAVTLPADAPAYAVDATTSNGRVTTDVRTDPGADGTLTLSTSNGDVDVGY